MLLNIRLWLVAFAVIGGLLLWVSSGSARSEATLKVDAKANIFAAGFAVLPFEEADAGVLPVAFRFTAGSGKVLTFSRVTAKLKWGDSNTFGPDGDSYSTNIRSLGAISGMFVKEKSLFLAGVFLGNKPPAGHAPPRLRLSSPESMKVLAPKLQQTFYIGDGHTAKGEVQQFKVPPTATRLYLGFVDAVSFTGKPGAYGDNKGAAKAIFSIGRAG